MHFSDDYSRMKEFIEKFKYNEDVKVIEIEDSMEKSIGVIMTEVKFYMTS